VEDILLQVRSFGSHETLANIKGFKLRVRRVIGWTEDHINTPGTVVHAYNNIVVIAVRNGYIAMTEWIPDGLTQQVSQPMATAMSCVSQKLNPDAQSMLRRACVAAAQ
jgi:hypothetical protein